MKRGAATILLALGLAAPAPASAYTLVLRSGGRIDIGETYRLDGSNVEYLAGPGTVRRMDLAAVDLQATARANGETVSTFVARATRGVQATRARRVAPAQAVQPPEPAEPTLTVTNADLEPYREERERLDAEYYARHPEARRTADQEPALAAAPAPEPPQLDEQQWRDEWRSLQDQVDAEQDQIDAIRDEIAYRQSRPFKYGLSYEYNFGRAPIIFRGGQAYSLANPLYPSLRADEEISQLQSRLIDLEIQHRESVLRRDRFLERARLAGVPPGWLRE